MAHGFWKSQPAQEVAEMVCHHELGEPHLIGNESLAGKTCPVQSILAFLNSLFRRATLIVEMHYIPSIGAHVGHNEPDSWKQFTLMPLDFATTPRFLFQLAA